jgi:ferredoxin
MTAPPLWRVVVDGDACVGSGVCAATAPAHFTLPDDRAVPTTNPTAAHEAILDAAACCPAGAITVHDAATGAVIDPDG